MQEALASALSDSEKMVRIGAALAAPSILGTEAAGPLVDRFEAIDPRREPEEAAALAIGLANARADAAPFVAAIFDEPVGGIEALLADDYSRWAAHLTMKTQGGLIPVGAGHLLSRLLGAIRLPGVYDWRPQTEAERVRDALGELRKWWAMARGDFSDADRALRGDNTLAPGYRALEAGDTGAGAQRLTEATICAPDPWSRIIARKALAALEIDAALPLLQILGGQQGPQPTRETIASFWSEARRSPELGLRPADVAVFLAAEALQDFSDPATTLALLHHAGTGSGEMERRVRPILLGMATENALPALTWAASNRPSERQRRVAMGLLESRLNRVEIVGGRQIPPVALAFLLRAGRTKVPAWLETPAVAIPVLRKAITVITDLISTNSITFSTLLTLDRFQNYQDAAVPPPIAGGSGRRLDARIMSGAWIRAIATKWLRPSDAERLSRHPRFIFSGDRGSGTGLSLSIRLLPIAADGTGAPFDVPFNPGEDTTELLVLAHCETCTVGPEIWSAMQVPREGPSSEVRFQLTPSEAGEHTIDIKFLAGTAPVGHYLATFSVENPQAETIVLDPVPDGFDEKAGARVRLRVAFDKMTGNLRFHQIEASTPKPRSLGCSPATFRPEAIGGWTSQFTDRIKAFQSFDLSPGNLQGVLAQLAALGASLLEQLAPPELVEAFARLPEDCVVAIETNADWIPWELLACNPAGPLWGERFTLVRTPLIGTAPRPPAVAVPDTAAPLERALLVVGGNIKSAPDHLPSLTFGEAMAARARPPLVQSEWPALVEAARNADVIHFACHGGGWPNALSYGSSDAQKLLPSQSRALNFPSGAVVFANACESAVADLMLAGFQSFGREFYLAGARPFIGTLGPVPEAEAVAFARLFYDAFAVQGLTAGQAMRAAKEQAKRRFKVPIWLFYCLYGSESIARSWKLAT